MRIGIDSISLNPDSVFDTTRRILALERAQAAGAGAPAQAPGGTVLPAGAVIR